MWCVKKTTRVLPTTHALIGNFFSNVCRSHSLHSLHTGYSSYPRLLAYLLLQFGQSDRLQAIGTRWHYTDTQDLPLQRTGNISQVFICERCSNRHHHTKPPGPEFRDQMRLK